MIESVFASCVFLSLTSWFALAAYRNYVALERPIFMVRLTAAVTIIATITVLATGQTVEALPVLIGLACSLVCALTDLASGYVFDRVSLPAAAGATISSIAAGHGTESIAGLGCGFTTIFLLWAITRGRGLGLGDAKLAGAIGAAAGASDVLVTIGVAFVLGALFSIVGLATKRLKRNSTLRFAPFLATAFLTAIPVCGISA